MCDLVCDRYPVLQVMSRFGIALGFGDKTIAEVCAENKVDTETFLAVVGMSVKLLRSSCIEESKKDYVRTAYSKGNNTNKVLYRHVLRNAMIPVITLWGMTLADMLVGSIVIEQVFNIPGIGRILLTSISYRDYPVVEAIIVLIAFVVIVTNFLVDVVYQLIDPRISV